jgi:dUTP pyrophosphatase
MNIVVDIDGVLANVDSYIKALNRTTGKNFGRENMTWYAALWDLYGKIIANRTFRDDDVIKDMASHSENVAELVIWLHAEEQYDVSIVTSRPVEVQKATRKWLDDLGIIYPLYHVKNKAIWAQDQAAHGEKIDVWIDDCVEVCEGVDAHVRATFLVNRPWNLGEITWIPRIENLWAVTRHIRKREKMQREGLLVTNISIESPKLTGDVGYDLRCMRPYSFQPGSFHRVAVGAEFEPLKVAIPEGYWGFIMSRSRLLEQGLVVLSTPIDSGYRGPLYVFAHNVGSHRIVLGEDERIAQLVLIKSHTPPLYLVDILPSSERGEQGFGSTGK